ncbi:hypothetical protein ACDN41_11930 [Priestia aryabhattai]|uniref:hypothetical protein n=1 Tax=Priestia aryabhattai TaxID=412384 RepID=UPI003531D740
MIEVRFECKYKGSLYKKFTTYEELDTWIDENVVNYDIISAYEMKDGKWVEV